MAAGMAANMADSVPPPPGQPNPKTGVCSLPA